MGNLDQRYFLKLFLGSGLQFPLNMKWSTYGLEFSPQHFQGIGAWVSVALKWWIGGRHVGLACIVRVERWVGSFRSYLSSHPVYSVNHSCLNLQQQISQVRVSLPLQGVNGIEVWELWEIVRGKRNQFWVKGRRSDMIWTKMRSRGWKGEKGWCELRCVRAVNAPPPVCV